MTKNHFRFVLKERSLKCMLCSKCNGRLHLTFSGQKGSRICGPYGIAWGPVVRCSGISGFVGTRPLKTKVCLKSARTAHFNKSVSGDGNKCRRSQLSHLQILIGEWFCSFSLCFHSRISGSQVFSRFYRCSTWIPDFISAEGT